jgi:hypothetical protein
VSWERGKRQWHSTVNEVEVPEGVPARVLELVGTPMQVQAAQSVRLRRSLGEALVGLAVQGRELMEALVGLAVQGRELIGTPIRPQAAQWASPT